MAKNLKIIIKRDPLKGWIVKRVSEKHGVSSRYIRMVMDGERENPEIVDSYMFLLEGSNELITAVNNLVPFNKK